METLSSPALLIIVMVTGLLSIGTLVLLVIKVMAIYKRDVDKNITKISDQLFEVLCMKKMSDQVQNEIQEQLNENYNKLLEIQDHLNKN